MRVAFSNVTVAKLENCFAEGIFTEAMENLSFLPHLICIPCCSYFSYRLYRLRQRTFMKKRSLSLLFGFNISLIMCMISNLIAIFATLYLDIQLHASHAYVLQMISVYFILVFLNTRTWLLYFNKKWTYFVMQLKWQQLINPKVLEKGHKNNWYIMTRYRYGNLSYIYKSFTIIHIIAIFISTIAIYLIIDSSSWQLQISGVIALFEIYLIFIAFYVIIRRKTPHDFQDVFHIQWENNCLSKLWFIGSILTMFVSIIAAYFSGMKNKHQCKLWTIALLLIILIIVI